MEDMVYHLVVIGGGIVIAGLGWGLKKLTDMWGSKVKNERVQEVIWRLDDAIMTAVKSVHQSFVEPLKNKEKFTAEDKALAKKMALEAMKDYMGPKGMEEASKLLGFNDQAANGKIEAAVLDMNKKITRL